MNLVYFSIVLFMFWFPFVISSDSGGQVLNTLMRAVEADDLEKLKDILESEDNKYVRVEDFDTLLLKGISLHSEEVVKYLVQDHSVKINQDDMLMAATRGSSEILRLLIENGGDYNVTDKFGDNLLHKAVRSNYVGVVKELAKYKNLVDGANILNSKPIDVTTIIDRISTELYIDTIKVLVEAGSYVPDQLIWNFWYFRISDDMIKYLIEKSDKVNVRVTWDVRDCRESLLMMYLDMSDVPRDMVEFLLKEGADVNIVYCNNMTALHRAVTLDEEVALDLVKLLLENGAVTSVRNGQGFTPLQLAEKLDKKKLAQYLKIK